MKHTSDIAQKATEDITAFLFSQKATVAVINVEKDSDYQQKDIDLLWEFQKNGETKKASIEIKADRWHQTGNYFFETISNESKGTPGCFLYTEAKYVFYYYLTVRELHILPMPEVRNWFLININEFEERKTSTPVGGGKSYVTVGRLVPRERAQKETLGIRVIRLNV